MMIKSLRKKIFETEWWPVRRLQVLYSLAVNSVGFVPPKTNMDTPNNGFEKLNMAMFGIYVGFPGV